MKKLGILYKTKRVEIPKHSHQSVCQIHAFEKGAEAPPS